MGTPTGIGVGLRMDMAEDLLRDPPPAMRFVEVHPENYMRRGGRYPALLKKALDRWPVLTHGLSMGFGNVEPPDADYLTRLRAFLRDTATPWHSDHMCFGGALGGYAHDLLPLPFTEEALTCMAANLTRARGELGIPLGFENLSYYANAPESETDEVGFVVALLERADTQMLLDVNNVYVNSRNHGFDAKAWIDRIPAGRVMQIHVAGHFVRPDGFRIDTHAEPMCDDVYDLLEHTLARMGPKPVLLERDGNFPAYAEIQSEVARLAAVYERAMAKHAGGAR